ncbi:MAG: SapC family protein [Pseudomonadota bacterium]
MSKKDKDAGANGKDGATQAGQMPLFYKQPMPLDSKEHVDLALKADFGFGFTEGVNAVPINLIEMPQICHFYPIAFSPDASATPVAIMGLRNNENLYLQQDGGWVEAYIPAYIRRYPFIFSEAPGQEQLTLCVDSNDAVLQKGGERKFFDGEGKPTEITNNALEFCKSYHAAAQQTIEFSKVLVEHDLLVQREAQINVANNQKINFSGFNIINEEKLQQLDDKVFIELRQKGWLPFIYAHLFSGSQWQRLTHMLNQRLEKDAA